MDIKNKPIIKILILFIVIILMGFVIKNVFFDGEEYSINVNKELEHTHKMAYEDKMYVDIKGAINNPGVYVFTTQAIVEDVINLAGGFSDNADTEKVNCAEKIFDGMKIIIPERKSQSSLDIYKDILNTDD